MKLFPQSILPRRAKIPSFSTRSAAENQPLRGLAEPISPRQALVAVLRRRRETKYVPEGWYRFGVLSHQDFQNTRRNFDPGSNNLMSNEVNEDTVMSAVRLLNIHP